MKTEHRNVIILAASGLVLSTVMATLAACTATAPSSPPVTVDSVVLTTLVPVTISVVPPGTGVPRPRTEHQSAFLEELDHWKVPRSTSGAAEVEIGVGICDQLVAGHTVGAIAQQLTSTSWTLDQAEHVVAAARGELCHG